MWSRLCGPVFLYDLVRLSRRGSATLYVVRSVYVTSLLALLLLLYARETNRRTPDAVWEALRAGLPLACDHAASFGADFCHALLALQWIAAFLLTPAFTAGALSEERERRTLDFLLASDLSNREIILGKWLAYLVRPILVLAAGLPVLAVVQLLGGVEPMLILVAFAATALSIASLGALGVLVSLYTPQPRAAILVTYSIMAAYGVFSIFCVGGIELDSLILAGNPLLALQRLEKALAVGRSLTYELPAVFLDYSIFHGTVTLLALVLAIHYLRRPLLTPQADVESLLRRHNPQPPSAEAMEAASRIPIPTAPGRRAEVSGNPVLWRELHVEAGLSPSRDFFGFLLTAATWFGLLLVVASLILVLHSPAAVAEWVRWVGTCVACLMTVGIALRAAGSFSRERERQTLDNLLASPLSSLDIINGKWLGSLLSVRRGFWGLGFVWFVGVVTGNLKLSAVPLLVITWLAYAFLAASVGVFCSLHSRSTWRATIATLLFLTLFWTLPSLLCLPVFSPPETLMLFASLGQQAPMPRQESLYPMFVLFLCEHYLIALGLWHAAGLRFAAATGRVEGVRQKPSFAQPAKRSALPSSPPRSLC